MAPLPDATENGDGQHVHTTSNPSGDNPEEAATNSSNIPSRLLIPGTEAVARQVGLRRWNRYCLESMRFYRKWLTYENFLDSEEVLQGISELERYRTRDALQLHIEVYAELRQLNTLYMYFLGYKPRDT